MVKRWCVRLTIVGALVSGASCLISVKDYPLEHGDTVDGGGDSGSSSDGPLAGEAGEKGGTNAEGGASAGGGTGGAAPVDLCKGVTCKTPPGNDCTSGSEFQSYDKVGSCADGMCSYVSHQTACTCANHACTTDPCTAVTCASPPAAACTGVDGNTQTTYSGSGTCSAGSCSYVPTNKACMFGCANGACKPDPGAGGSGGVSGVGGNSGGGSGAGGTVGTAGAQGNAGAGGTGGAPVLLSQGKTASADSEQTGNLAPAGNDGSLTSRWSAADGAVGHYWKVDLAQSSTLTKLHIVWEKGATLYKFKVEGSTDNLVWVSLLDETNGTSTIADQTYPLSPAPTARWVRITVMTLPDPNTWASFFEFQVYGH